MTGKAALHLTDDQPAWETFTDLSVGEILRRTRIHYNLDLPAVEAALRIRASQLGALEDGRLDLLPGRAYAIGFVRTYAEYLGLDGGKIVQLFKVQSVGGKARPELSFPAPASETKVPNIWIMAGSLAGIVVLLTGLSLFASAGKKSGHEAIPPVNAAAALTGSLPINMDDAVRLPLNAAVLAAADSVAATLPQIPKSRITIKATASVWVEIHDGAKKTILSRILKPGDIYLVPDQPGLKLDTGNAGVLELTVDGDTAPKLGAIGDVKRGLLLEPEAIKNPPPPKAVAGHAKRPGQ